MRVLRHAALGGSGQKGGTSGGVGPPPVPDPRQRGSTNVTG
jgi:hypothetical protein